MADTTIFVFVVDNDCIFGLLMTAVEAESSTL